MASGIGALFTLQGKVDAGNALVVTATGSGSTTVPSGGGQPVAQLQGKVDSSNRLVVRFV